VALFASFALVYALSGIYGRDERQAAIANSGRLDRLEHALGIAWEQPLQHWASGHRLALDLANYTYFSCQFIVSTAFLLWLYARRHGSFGVVRDALVSANVLSLVILFLYPAAPPRLVPGSRVLDTLAGNSVSLQSSVVDALNNPYAAMPSLHASYALVLGATGVLLVRRRGARWLWALYPPLVCYSVLATGNHYLLDVVAGALVLLPTPLVRLVAARLAASAPVAPAVQPLSDPEAFCER
jgi:membrane-associated phospholipid phosphatase